MTNTSQSLLDDDSATRDIQETTVPSNHSNSLGVERKQSAQSGGLILPDRVALMLDTALSGDKAPNGTAGHDGKPRSKNLTVLVGTVRAMTTGKGDDRRIVTNLGAVEYRYELSINEVIGNESGVARTSYRLPISMSDAVRARYGHLLQDGQRIALLGPLGMEEFYDQRFQRDTYDAGRRTWDVRIDVLTVQEVGDEVPDMAWVQLEGEVVDRPRIYPRQYGEQRGLVEHYASVTLRYREVLTSTYGAAVRPVVKSVPVEVLVAGDEEVIPMSDALLRPGNKVRIEGRLNPAVFRLSRRTMEDETIKDALERTRVQIEHRNAGLEQGRDSNRQGRQQSLNPQALERQIARAQQRLLTGRRVRVEVGYVELLHGEAVRPEQRAQLISEGEERRRNRASAHKPRPAVLDPATLAVAQQEDIVEAMHDQTIEPQPIEPGANTISTNQLPSTLRPRRMRSFTTSESEAAPEMFVTDGE